MPRKDGRTVLKELKTDPELRQIPVVVLTTSKADEDIYKSYDLGVSCGIGVADVSVPSPSNNVAVAHDHCSHRHLSSLESPLRCAQRFLHP